MSDLLSILRNKEVEQSSSSAADAKFDFNRILNGDEQAWNDLKAESGVKASLVAPMPKKILPAKTSIAGASSTAASLPAARVNSVCLLMPTIDFSIDAGFFNYFNFNSNG